MGTRERRPRRGPGRLLGCTEGPAGLEELATTCPPTPHHLSLVPRVVLVFICCTCACTPLRSSSNSSRLFIFILVLYLLHVACTPLRTSSNSSTSSIYSCFAMSHKESQAALASWLESHRRCIRTCYAHNKEWRGW